MGNDETIMRHREASRMWPNGRPETHAECALRVALAHLDKVLNGCRTHAEQQAADTTAREFLARSGY